MAMFTVSPAMAQAVVVIDGDTIRQGDTTFRLWGIDAPESTQQCQRGDSVPYDCGKDASAHLRELVADQPVTCEPKTRDRYGRTVAICGTPSIPDLGRAMVRDGWVVAFVRYSRDYISEEAEARDAKRGLWSGSFELPWNWRAARRTQ
jgi:endonuclease YncB( thermonuclease family)